MDGGRREGTGSGICQMQGTEGRSISKEEARIKCRGDKVSSQGGGSLPPCSMTSP